MPTLRERPSRGEISPAKKTSPTSRKVTTPRSQRTADMAGDAIEVRESIEAKGDVEMQDVGDVARHDPGADLDATGSDVDADGDVDMDAEGSPDYDAHQTQQDQSSIDLLQLIKEVSEFLCQVTVPIDGEDHEIASAFQRLVNKRSLPDYFDVIKEPMAFSTIRAKIGKKTYETFNEFVRDVTRICHNAQVYNRPSSLIFSDAGLLLDVFKKKLGELVEKGTIKPEDAVLPDYGPLPDVEDSPPPVEEEEEVDEDEEEEEEEDDEDDDETEDEGGRRRGRRPGRQASRRSRGDGDDTHRKGRPPKVLTPLEGRIDEVLKGLRKYKNDDGQLGIYHFERLPDKVEVPDYFVAIQEPIALDIIKKKYKRKKYQNLDQLLRDLNLMFDNAMTYNEDGSVVYEDAKKLKGLARELVEEQRARPDEEFRDEDGKLPLAGIQRLNRTYVVGDWVHIRNANDVSKPIVAQLYRLWSDKSGQKWVNACWYYRPEQTVHRFDKFFWENEVFKTGRYRDHRIEEVEDICFVMFHTRYPRGRPRGFPTDKSVYVCESRYNEEKHRFNKIKTWNSVLPDEVRDRDYEMDLFEAPRPMKKEPSKIKHLLQVDAKETDDLPKPTWGAMNAPPMIGAVHRRPRGPNDSPPPGEIPAGHTPARPPMGTYHAAGQPPVASAAHFQQFQVAPRQVPQAVPHAQLGPGQLPLQAQVQMAPMPHIQHQGMAHMQPQPMQMQMQPTQHFSPHPGPGPGPGPGPSFPPQFAAQSPAPQQIHYQNQSHLAPTFDPHHRQVHHTLTPSRPSTMAASTTGNVPVAPNNPGAAAVYNPPRAPEVYTLADNVDAAIPKEVRDDFQCDDQGRILFFTAPPINRPNKGVTDEFANLGHSASHLASIEQLRQERRAKKRERDNLAALEAAASKKARENKDKLQQMRTKMQLKEYERLGEVWIEKFVEEMNEGTEAILAATGAIHFATAEEKERFKNMTDKERRVESHQFYADYCLRNGIYNEEQKKQYEDTYIHRYWVDNIPHLRDTIPPHRRKQAENSDTNGHVDEGDFDTTAREIKEAEKAA